MSKEIYVKDIARVTNGKSDVKDAKNIGKYTFFDRSVLNKRSDKYIFDGEAIIIPGEDSREIFEPRYYDGKFDLHQRCYAIYDFEDIIYPKFLYYKLKTLTKHFANVCVGSTVPSLRLDHITDLKVTIPPKSSQVKISEVLSSLDSKIDHNIGINLVLEEVTRVLYDYWFVQFDFPDANGKPYKSSGGKMVYSEDLKRNIPQGWEVLTLDNIVELVRGNVSPSDIDVSTPYVGLEHIGRKTIVLSNWASSGSANSDKTAFKKNDILFGKIRPYFHKIAVAPFDGITSTDTIILRPRKESLFGFALETVFADEFVDAATKSSTGSKMPRADWGVLKNYKIPVPSTELQELFQSIFEGALKNIHMSAIENKSLTELRDWLLPMLMNGQVTVK